LPETPVHDISSSVKVISSRSLFWIDFAKIALSSQVRLHPPGTTYSLVISKAISIPSIVSWDNQRKLLSGPCESGYSAASRSGFFRHEVTSRPLLMIAIWRRSHGVTRLPVSQNNLNTDLCSRRHFDIRLPKTEAQRRRTAIVLSFNSKCKSYLNLIIYVARSRLLRSVYSQPGSPLLCTHDLSLHNTVSHQIRTQSKVMKCLVQSSHLFSFVHSFTHKKPTCPLFAATYFALLVSGILVKVEKLMHLVPGRETDSALD
jgi:hypothetical protein